MELPNPLFFAGWWPIVRILVVGTLAYFSLLFTLRAGGPRTIAKTNLFDFIVSVAIGSVFGRILTAKEVALSEACLAFALLVSLQYLVSKIRQRSDRFASIVDVKPELLFFNGAFVAGALARARLREKDVQEALRNKGFGSFAEVSAVVLEPSGEISVLRRGAAEDFLPEQIRKNGAS